MLQNRLYYIIQSNQDEYTIRFEASHPIFAGHFPTRPIVPGACLVQIAEELASVLCGHQLCFTALRNLKFNQPVTPDQEVIYILKNTNQAFSVQILVGNVLCTQFSVHYDKARNY